MGGQTQRGGVYNSGRRLPGCEESLQPTLGACTPIPTPVTDTPLLQIKSGGKRIFGREFVDEGGASSNWLFVAPTSRSPSGKAIVKVWGLGAGGRAGKERVRSLIQLAVCGAPSPARPQEWTEQILPHRPVHTSPHPGGLHPRAQAA